MPNVLHTPRTSRALAAACLLFALAAAPAQAQTKPLFERLGGYPAISAVVDDFADRLFADPKLKTFFGGMSSDSRARFRQLNVELICGATGGPCRYLGRSMETSHKGLAIGDADFGAVAAHLVATLDKFKVPAAEKEELLKIVGSLRPAIVERP